MQWTKKDIENALVFADDKTEFILIELPMKAPERTLAQNATFYVAFDKISKHMWTKVDILKQNCMKALFWITKSKFWWVWYENANISKTSKLNIEQWTLLIETLIEFWKKLWMWIIITSREVQTLFNNNKK